MKNFFFRHWRLVLVESLLLIIMLGSLFSLISEGETVSIAVVVPSEFDNDGKGVVEILQIYADRQNKFGGVDGKKLKIQPYYDQGDPKIARKVAQEIVDKNKFIAVLGHFSKTTTQAAIDIYDKAKIPLVAPISNITTDSKWAFQTSPTPKSYGVHMAHYIKQVLLKKSITIIHSKLQDDVDLIESFVKTFVDLGGTVEKKLILGSNKNTSEINLVVNNLEHYPDDINHNNDCMLLLVAQQTAPLIIALKDKGIEIPIMSTDTTLGNKLDTYEQKNKKYLGYYSEGIYVPTSILSDTIPPHLALTVKKYGENRYVSSSVLQAIKSTSLIIDNLDWSKNNDLNVMHLQLQTKLKQNFWFNAQQQGMESLLFIGVFKQQQLVTAPINPTVIMSDKLTAEQNSKLLKINDNELYPTDFVYTGIAINKISDIDSNTYNMDFFLWFRYGEMIKNVDDIEFLNTVKPAKLFDILAATKNSSTISNDNMTATLVESNSFNGEKYRRYHIKGRFKTFDSKNYVLGQQDMYIRFRNCNSNLLILYYVSGFINKGIFNLEEGRNIDLFDDESLTLKYNYAYSRLSYKMMLGNPENMSQSNLFVQFVAAYRVEPILWSFRGILAWVNQEISGKQDQIDMGLMILLLSISCSIFIFILYGQRHHFFGKTASYWWLLQVFIIFFILLFGELVLSQSLFNLTNSMGHFQDAVMQYIEYTIAILWWIIPAYYITSALEQFLWQPIKKRTGAEIPHVLRLFVTIFIYVLATFGIMAFVLKVTVTGLAATSGIVAIIFAIASKIDLSNIMAGLGISFSKVFKMGDWVKIDAVEGQIIEMTPRSTKVLTFNSSIINIPNTTVSTAIIENYTHPNPAFRLIIRVEIVPIYRFERVEKILLDAVASTENILNEPQPKVIFKGQGDSSQIYEVAFFIDDYAKRYSLWQATWRRIWRHLEQADITLATPQREIFMPKEMTTDISAPLNMINNCGVFAGLSDESKTQLAQKLQIISYRAGDIILSQEEVNDSLFIITEGVISFEKKSATGDIVEVQRLGVAEVFGQMSLLNCKVIDATVRAKTDTELFEIKKENFILAI